MSYESIDKCNRDSRLNPYYIGRYSMRRRGMIVGYNLHCLNPYYIGRYSMRVETAAQVETVNIVLILIILEDTL